VELRNESIKEMRRRREALNREARKLNEENPGASFKAVEKEFDLLLAEADSLTRRMGEAQDQLNSEMEAKLGGGVRAEGVEWRNPDTGAKVPVAYANQGSFRDQLQTVFPGSQDNSQPKASISEFMRGVAGMKLTEAVRNTLLVGTDAAGGILCRATCSFKCLRPWPRLAR
jgi:HK97 family phage major capsid protein